MASIEQISRAIDLAYKDGDYEVVQELTLMLRQEVAKKDRGDAGFVENVLSGLGAGAVGMYESAALGGAALLEEEEELKARDKIQSVWPSAVRPEGGDQRSPILQASLWHWFYWRSATHRTSWPCRFTCCGRYCWWCRCR